MLAELAPRAALLHTEPLTGGVSATVTALEVLQGGQRQKWVLRQYGVRDLATKPRVAAQEFALLERLYAAGLPVPKPLAYTAGALLTEFLNGQNGTQTPPDPIQMAQFLARLHSLEAASVGLPALSSPPTNTIPDESLSESNIRATLSAFSEPIAPSVMLHGDFWAGNTLWDGGQLSGVIDWEDAALGPALADLSNGRLELLFFAGEAAMHALTAEYRRLTPANFSALPYWDLRAALRLCGRLHTWGLPELQEGQMREQHAWFVKQACSAL